MSRSIVVGVLAALLLASPVLAAKTVLNVEADGAHFGDTVLVTVSGNTDAQVWARVGCYSNVTTEPASAAGTHILDTFAYLGTSPGVNGDAYITLGPNSPYWTGGGADCVAQLWDSRRWRPMANAIDEFSVLP